MVCSDKTGTLTQNQMTVASVYADSHQMTVEELSPEKNSLFYLGFLLCNDAAISDGVRLGDPTELALVDMGIKAGLDKGQMMNKYPRIGENPFDSGRKMMSTVHEIDGHPVMFTKGSCDILLRRCTHIKTGRGVRAMALSDCRAIERAMEQMTTQAQRVLGLAYKTLLPDTKSSIKIKDENDLTFIGMVGMIDPPRKRGKRICRGISQGRGKNGYDYRGSWGYGTGYCKTAGHSQNKDECLTGEQLDALSETQLKDKIGKISVFARVSPEHKVRIVNLLKSAGNIVAMTGDGVNDAPALKAARHWYRYGAKRNRYSQKRIGYDFDG